MQTLGYGLLALLCTTQAIAAGDPAIGKSTAVICIGCHGSDGNSSNPAYPKLAGQGQKYLMKQLTDFKSGARQESHMSSMVEAIDKADIANLAAWFASHKTATGSYDKGLARQGKTIFHNGIDRKNIAACDGCHGEDGRGNPAVSFPSLAGQHPEYISRMLAAFRSKQRHNDNGEMMRNIAAGLSNEEIEAVAHYVASLNKG